MSSTIKRETQETFWKNSFRNRSWKHNSWHRHYFRSLSKSFVATWKPKQQHREDDSTAQSWHTKAQKHIQVDMLVRTILPLISPSNADRIADSKKWKEANQKCQSGGAYGGAADVCLKNQFWFSINQHQNQLQSFWPDPNWNSPKSQLCHCWKPSDSFQGGRADPLESDLEPKSTLPSKPPHCKLSVIDQRPLDLPEKPVDSGKWH